MATALELEYSGCANGAPLAVTGEGRVEHRKAGARLMLKLEAQRAPLLWDPALALPGLGLAAAADVEGEGSPVIVQTRSHLWDENGREAGEWAEAAVIEQVEGVHRWRVQLVRCNVRFEPLERVRAIDTFRLQSIQTGEEWSAMTAACSFTTGHGNCYRAVTVSMVDRPVSEENLGARLVRLTRESTASGGESVSTKWTLTAYSRAFPRRQ